MDDANSDHPRVVDVLAEQIKFMWLVRGRSEYLVDRYSGHIETAAETNERVSKK